MNEVLQNEIDSGFAKAMVGRHFGEEEIQEAKFWFTDGFLTAMVDREWLPIETAPKDGTRILFAMEGVDRAILGYWTGAAFVTIDGHDWTGKNITHWMPLPEPPK